MNDNLSRRLLTFSGLVKADEGVGQTGIRLLTSEIVNGRLKVDEADGQQTRAAILQSRLSAER